MKLLEHTFPLHKAHQRVCASEHSRHLGTPLGATCHSNITNKSPKYGPKTTERTLVYSLTAAKRRQEDALPPSAGNLSVRRLKIFTALRMHVSTTVHR